jgi:hypothetical protein
MQMNKKQIISIIPFLRVSYMMLIILKRFMIIFNSLSCNNVEHCLLPEEHLIHTVSTNGIFEVFVVVCIQIMVFWVVPDMSMCDEGELPYQHCDPGQ